VCCSVLRGRPEAIMIAVSCRVLQCVAVYCSEVPCVALCHGCEAGLKL